jgi:membrane protease YdiL (CAAX protease family)
MKLVEDTRVNVVDASAKASPVPPTLRLPVAALVFCALLMIFWFIARYFHVQQVEEHPVSTLLSFALLFAPYWFFGFGAAEWLRRVLPRASGRIGAAALLALPYFVLAIPRAEFHWMLAATLVGLALLSAGLVERWKTPGNWADVFVLATAGLVIDLGLLNTSGPLAVPGTTLWPPGLGGFPKMMMMNVALYCYLVVKPLEGIGYDLTPRFSDVKTGLRELLFYMPIVLPLGFWLGFLQFHRATPPLFMVPAAWIFTFAFVAMPEELFFRGLVQNLLERRMTRTLALLMASILFGLSHFNKHAGGHFLVSIAGHSFLFNWRYVLLATIAGIFYGRAWRDKRRLFASSITHTSVDTVWSLLFRKAIGS